MKTSLGYNKMLITEYYVLVIKNLMYIRDNIKKEIYDVLRESQTEFVDE